MKTGNFIEIISQWLSGQLRIAMRKDEKIRNAILIGGLCSLAYLAVYFARNILSAVTPQITEQGILTTEFIGSVSSTYFVCYAFGQLINGAVGDKIKARYMISFGLILAGICNFCFANMTDSPAAVRVIYGMTGLFLSMIYGPMTKVVAENTEPVYATRCSLGYTFASFFGSPLAGVAAAVLTWQSVFAVSSIILVIMGLLCFLAFLLLEKRGIVRYNQYRKEKEEGAGITILIQHRIIKFIIVALLTGVIRTSVVFWLPTYISQYLGYRSDKSAAIFTVVTFVISMNTFVAIFVYECFGRDMDKTIRVAFTTSALAFMGVYLVHQPVVNIILMVVAIMASNSAATMMYSRYCPGLRDTGMVSAATGFLDFVSYMAAAAASYIFANAVSVIGWEKLILVWFGLMVVGIIFWLPDKLIGFGKKSS